MPLSLQFLRDGEPRTMPNGFGHWHLGVAYDAGAIEQARIDKVRLPDRDVLCTSLRDMDDAQMVEFDRISALGRKAFNQGTVKITKPIRFRDPSDGEVLEFLPGDEIRMWR
jgi:hypothetical protein